MKIKQIQMMKKQQEVVTFSWSGHAQRALYVVGGTSLLLPLFAQLEPTQKNLKNPKTTTSSTGIVVSLDTENAKEKEKKDISGDGSEDMVYDEALVCC